MFARKLILSSLFVFATVCSNGNPPVQLPVAPFLENNGQVLGTDNNLHPENLFYTDVNGLRAYFQTNKIAHVWQRRDTINDVDTLYRMDLILAGSNPYAPIVSSNQAQGLYNFFMGYLPVQVTGVKTWNTLTYTGIYSYTDLTLTNTGTSIDYFFNLDPSADLADIKLRIEGASSVQVHPNGRLTISTPYGDIIYDKPKGKKFNANNANGVPVNLNFNWNGSEIVLQSNSPINGRLEIRIERLAAPPTPPVLPVINQELNWSTYFGGSNGTELHGSHLDAQNNFYNVGGTAQALFPFSNSLPITFNGGWDAIALKFNSNRQLIYGTFIGGSSNDEAWAITTDINGDPCFVGPSNSNDFPLCASFSPACTTTVQNSSLNTQCGFYVKLDNSLLASSVVVSTYLGYEVFANGGFDIASDNFGNIYIGTSSFPDPIVQIVNSGGAYNQPVHGGGFGDYDGYIAKFDINNDLVWATFLGGNGQDVITNLTTDASGNLYVMGWSFSQCSLNACGAPCMSNSSPGTFPIADPQNGMAYLQFINGSQRDIFIAQFNPANALVWSTMFGGGGDDGYQEGHTGGIAVDDLTGSIYITSTTASNQSVGDIPITPSTQPLNQDVYWQNVMGGISDALIAKFSRDFELVYCTYYGGDGQDLGSDIAIGNALGASIIYFTGSMFMLPYTTFPVMNRALFYNDAANGTGQGYVVTLTDDPNNGLEIPERLWASCYGTGGTDGWFVSALGNKMLTGGWCNTNLQPAPFCNAGAFCQSVPQFAYNGCIIEFILHSCIVCPSTARLLEGSAIEDPLIYPNPSTSGKFKVAVPDDYIESGNSIIIYNALGEVVYEISFSNHKYLEIDLSQNSSGMYTAVVVCEQRNFWFKIVR